MLYCTCRCVSVFACMLGCEFEGWGRGEEGAVCIICNSKLYEAILLFSVCVCGACLCVLVWKVYACACLARLTLDVLALLISLTV